MEFPARNWTNTVPYGERKEWNVKEDRLGEFNKYMTEKHFEWKSSVEDGPEMDIFGNYNVDDNKERTQIDEYVLFQ